MAVHVQNDRDAFAFYWNIVSFFFSQSGPENEEILYDVIKSYFYI